ncbi:winged helix DNA-binding domain-containing protein [Nonomuraea sp. SBT364]|uniref:winged helix DNA-binding domain-containing protein n=1 Tax=Nonomuraea sp. SBT364 TaxID=1580530 RepID=UPI00066ABF9F|nr:winged helix DNA-binding domain-containing protein [Nonomuraea sp. SBT364]
MTWPQVSARRLARAGLAEPLAATPAEVVATMCGAHAQVMSAAELSVALRLENATRADVRAALWEERSLVKTYGPRSTVHLLPARDLAAWTGTLSSVPAAGGAFPPDRRLTAEQADQVVAAIAKAVDGTHLTIDELSDAVIAGTGPWAGDLVMPAFQTMWPRWRQAMGMAAHRGAFVFGPARGRKVTYTSPPDGFRPVAGDHGPLRAFLHAYGPATPEQFARWLGVPKRWAVAQFATAGLEEVSFAGSAAYVLAGDTGVPAGPPSGVRLLPYFDAYLVAGQPRELLYAGAAAQRALAGGQAGNFPVLLIDGQVTGVWHQRRSGSRIEVTVEPLRELRPAELGELREQVDRVGAILEGRARLTVGTVTVGAHA